MRSRRIALVAVGAGLILLPTAPQPGQAQTAEGLCAEQAGAFHAALDRAYSLKRYRHPDPAARADVADQIGCAPPARARRMVAKRKAAARELRDYRLYRRVATFPGPGHGPLSPADGRWWAIPWCVVAGESGGDFYVNADGGYQIIPSTWAAHGGRRFADVAGHATPLEQHIIAARARRAGEPWFGGCGLN